MKNRKSTKAIYPRITVRLTPCLEARLKAAASTLRRKPSELARMFIHDGLAAN